MSDQTVTLRINATSEKAVAATRAARSELDSLGKAAGNAGQQASRGSRGVDQLGDAASRTEKRIAALGGTVGRVKGFITGFAGAFASVQTIRGAAALADTYSDIVGKLSQVTKGERELATAKATTYAISQRYFQQLDATVTLYARAAGALAQYKVSQEGVAALTETINAGLLVSRATTAESASAILQLSQALGAGALRGEEFNAVNEAAPRLMQALADSLGRPRGELKKLAEDGKLTVDVLLKAWTGAEAQKIIEEATKVPMTIGRAWQLVRNQLTRYIGEADQAGGTSATIAQAIKAIGTNLPQIIGGLVTLAKVTAAWFLLFRGIPAVVAGLRGVRDMYVGISLAQSMGIRSSGIWAAATVANIMTVKAAAGLLFAAFAGWQVGKYLRENFLVARLAGIALVNGLLKGWVSVKEGAQLMWAAVTSAAGAAFNTMRGSLADFIGLHASAAELIPDMFGGAAVVGGLRALEGQLRTTGDASTSFAGKLIEIRNAAEAERAQIDAITGDMADYEIAQWEAKNASEGASAAAGDFSIELGNVAEKSKKTKDELKRLAEAQREFGRENERIAAQLAGPIAEAEFEYADGVAQANDALAKREATVAQVIQRERLLAEQKRRAIAEIEREQDVLGKVAADYAQQIRLSGMSAQARRVEEEVIRAVNDAMAAGKPLRDDEIVSLRASISEWQRIVDLNDAQQMAAEDFRNSWLNAVGSVADAFGDWIVGGLSSFKDFGRALKDIAKRFMADLISQFANNALQNTIGNWFRGITSGGFSQAGGQGGWMQMFQSMFGGQGGGQGIMGGISSWLGGLFGGGSSAAAGSMYGFGNVGNLAGVAGASSSLGGSAAAAGGGASTGAMSGLASIPVVGWIIAGMMANSALWDKGWDIANGESWAGKIATLGAVSHADKVFRKLGLDDKTASILSGSSIHAALFGRKKPEIRGQGLQGSFGFGGLDARMFADIVEKGGVFRSDKKYTRYGTVDSEIDRAFDQAARQVNSGATALAKQLGVDISQQLAAVKIDLGKVKLDKDPEKAQAQLEKLLSDMVERLAGESVKAAGFQHLLDDGFKATEMMSALGTAIQLVTGGAERLGRALNDWERSNVTKAVEWFEQLANVNGTEIAAEIERVVGTLRSYSDLMTGVETQLLTNGLNEYQKAQLDIEMGYRDQVKQANELAKSLGLTGARAEDLAKIEQLRAVNMASLQKQYEAQKDTFLEDLGLSDLSPLRDSEKLAESMQLLRDAVGAGDLQRAQQLSQQVLGFGRNLYASGADYNGLYGEVTGLLNGMSPATLEGFTESGLDNIADILEGLPDKFAQALFQQAAGINPIAPPSVSTGTPPPTPVTTTQPTTGSTDETNTLLRALLAAVQRQGLLLEMDSLNTRVNAL